jgi:acyl-CoA synthetase (AMP-forming)/AMP-acid ligase II
VCPARLEGVVLEHPAIADAAVIGVFDERAGEVPRAFVTLKGEVSSEQIMKYVAARVAPYEKIRRVEVLDAIPISPAGKLLRRVLKELEKVN